jgi:Icc-related predicted phosphoesterase
MAALQVMRLLAFSDLHRDRRQAERLVELAREADVVVGAGDFASMRLGLGKTIEALRAITAPSILVPGNNESDAQLWKECAIWENARILHGEGTEINGIQFFGLGGGVPRTPFPWSFDLTEEEATAKLEDCPDGAVLVLHSPPKGYVDEAFGRHLGSLAIRAAIERHQPALAVCGHIHQAWGAEAVIGATPVVNVGPEGRFFEL